MPPDSIAPAYPPPELIANTTSWGGSVLQDGDTYHMFVAEMSNGCGMGTWTTNSQVVHATSSLPEGPYERQAVINPAFSHNPTVSRAPDGTWVLYHIGCGDAAPTQCTDCAGGNSGHCPGGPETVSCTPGTTPNTTPTSANVLFASAPHGPWQSVDADLHGAGMPPRMGKFGIDNPTPYFFPNGSVLLLGRCDYSTVGLIRANSFRGPYELLSEAGDASTIHGVEDPFLYRDNKGRFHALFHGGQQGGDYPAAGAHAYSEDGLTWSYSQGTAFTTAITTSDGEAHQFNRRERPHLLFNADGQPTHLFTALTNWGKDGTDRAFTFAQAISTGDSEATV